MLPLAFVKKYTGIYYTYPDPATWAYSGLEGAIVFGSTERGRGGFWLKMVDVVGSRGVIWQHEFYDDLAYHQDRTFFHSFASDDCMVGIVYSDESEATSLYKKVSNRSKHAPKKTEESRKSGISVGGSSILSTGLSSSSSFFKRKRNVNKEEISQPSNPKHVAHMGFDSEKGFTAENVDPSWTALLAQLSSMGISEDQIKDNEAFIRDFVATAGGPEKAMAPPTRSAPPPAPSSRKAAPPAPASRRVEPPKEATARPVAPPSRVPPPRRPDAEVVEAPSSVPPPPPPPPMMPSSKAPPAPPSLPPQRAGPPVPPPAPPSNRSSIPPPPPAPPNRSAGPPAPPPPPPMANRSGPPGPPPPPPPPGAGASAAPSAALPAPQEGRGALLASIQGAGIHQLKKASGPAAGGAALGATAYAAQATTPQPEEEAGGADLAATLAAALSARKGNMGSDSEGSDDEEWED